MLFLANSIYDHEKIKLFEENIKPLLFDHLARIRPQAE